MQRREEFFHTAEQVQGYIDEARRIVTELELDDELRVPAFTKAIELLQGKNITFEQLAAVPHMAIPGNRRH